jgi:hypothetical protein
MQELMIAKHNFSTKINHFISPSLVNVQIFINFLWKYFSATFANDFTAKCRITRHNNLQITTFRTFIKKRLLKGALDHYYCYCYCYYFSYFSQWSTQNGKWILFSSHNEIISSPWLTHYLHKYFDAGENTFAFVMDVKFIYFCLIMHILDAAIISAIRNIFPLTPFIQLFNCIRHAATSLPFVLV